MTRFKEEQMSYSTHALRLFKNIPGISLVLLLSTGLAMANDLTLQPSSLALAAKQPTGTVKLINSSSEAKVVRIKVMSYSQENGREQLSPSTRLIVHPDQLTLQPGAPQSVRVGMRMSGPLWDEETYRLVVTEVPQSANVGDAAAKAGTVSKPSVVFLPVSVLPPGRSLSAR